MENSVIRQIADIAAFLITLLFDINNNGINTITLKTMLRTAYWLDATVFA
jgi:hypothetical protein